MASRAGYARCMSASSRPDLVPARSRLEGALEVVSLLAVAACVGVAAVYWDALPQRVPSHFGVGGNPDAYGSKSSVLTPVVAALGLHLLFTVIQRIPARYYNYPVRITADNALAQYRLARRCLATIKAGISLALACGVWMTVQVALGHRQGLSGWFLPGVLMVTLLPVIWYASAAYRQRRS